jgi:hypothetical protein
MNSFSNLSREGEMPINVTVRLSDEEDQDVQQGAEKHGTSRADLLRTGGLMLAEFDPAVWTKIKNLARRLNLPPALVIQNMMIDRMARDAAREIIYGIPDQRPLFEFQWTPEGPITGWELFENLTTNYQNEFRQKRFNELDHFVRASGGVEFLPDDDREFYEEEAAKIRESLLRKRPETPKK